MTSQLFDTTAYGGPITEPEPQAQPPAEAVEVVEVEVGTTWRLTTGGGVHAIAPRPRPRPGKPGLAAGAHLTVCGKIVGLLGSDPGERAVACPDCIAKGAQP